MLMTGLVGRVLEKNHFESECVHMCVYVCVLHVFAYDVCGSKRERESVSE